MCSNPVFLSLPPSFAFISLPHICFYVVSSVLCYCRKCNQLDHEVTSHWALAQSPSLIMKLRRRVWHHSERTHEICWGRSNWAVSVESWPFKLSIVTCAQPLLRSCWSGLQPGMLECCAQSEGPVKKWPGEPKNKCCRTTKVADVQV